MALEDLTKEQLLYLIKDYDNYASYEVHKHGDFACIMTLREFCEDWIENQLLKAV